jgi:nitroimidazol reductase NimA-like FMN-containing flavoprotein (pyridoxamine 5'-phosphate oxidase superfamily)
MRAVLSELLAVRKLAALSTHREGQPYASLIAFAAAPGLGAIYFVTPRATRKFANLAADGRAALLVSSSENRDADFHAAMAVTAVGSAAEIAEPERRQALAIYLAKHPYLEDFAAAPSCALMCFRPRSYILVRNFQHVMELHLPE